MKKRNLLLLVAVFILIPVYSNGFQLQVKIISEVADRELASAKFFNDVDYSKSDSTETK